MDQRLAHQLIVVAIRGVAYHLLLVGGVTLSCLGCARRSPTIHYVLPDNYRGAFIVYTSRPEGTSLINKDGTYVCTIPNSGILEVKDEGPFYSWHGTTASFASGDEIVIASHEDNLDDDAVALWWGGSRPGGMLYDFIGTKSEARLFKKAIASGPVNPGAIRAK